LGGALEKAVDVSLHIHKPYVLLMGDENDPIYAKTGLGIAQWDADNCVGQVRSARTQWMRVCPM